MQFRQKFTYECEWHACTTSLTRVSFTQTSKIHVSYSCGYRLGLIMLKNLPNFYSHIPRKFTHNYWKFTHLICKFTQSADGRAARLVGGLNCWTSSCLPQMTLLVRRGSHPMIRGVGNCQESSPSHPYSPPKQGSSWIDKPTQDSVYGTVASSSLPESRSNTLFTIAQTAFCQPGGVTHT